MIPNTLELPYDFSATLTQEGFSFTYAGPSIEDSFEHGVAIAAKTFVAVLALTARLSKVEEQALDLIAGDFLERVVCDVQAARNVDVEEAELVSE
ncbi:hypothetical protein [Castellaniella sp.]|uniref:hypothetical protein n=1 Tax=Castellaniella sp. TaxID=1955812 RepID=UPI002AFEBD73|nr:hypothetical protein [Castellaniella sp.]